MSSSTELNSILGELESAMKGPAVGAAMKILKPDQMALAITMAGARKRNDVVMVETLGKKFLGGMSDDQMKALGSVLPAPLVAKIHAYVRANPVRP